jgi:hypothetical protein
MDSSSCHILYPDNPDIFKVNNWISKEIIEHYYFIGNQYSIDVLDNIKLYNDKKPYNASILKKTFKKNYNTLFDNNSNIVTEPIYGNDTIYNITIKILALLNINDNSLFPYIWTNNGPIRFVINNNWKDYNINPFKIKDFKSVKSPDITQLSDKILKVSEINLAIYNNVEKILSGNVLKYYFPNIKDTITKNSIHKALKEQIILNKEWNTSREKHEELYRQSNCSYSRVIFTGNIKKINLEEVFNKLHSTQILPFIQFYDDINHIYYKVLKKHYIPERYIDEWTNMDKSPSHSYILLYSLIDKTLNSYAKLMIDGEGIIKVIYVLDINENISYNIIENHLNNIRTDLQKYTKIKFTPVIERLALKTSVIIKDANMKSLSKYLSNLLPIFDISGKNRRNKNILDIQFKRVEKYGEVKNILDIIKTKIDLDIPIEDIIFELQEYGIDENEVIEIYNQLLDSSLQYSQTRKKKDYKNLGLVLHISKISLGYSIYIDNAINISEIQSCLFWIRSAIINSKQTEKVKGETPDIEELINDKRFPIEHSISVSRVSPESHISISTVSPSDSQTSVLSLGGAIGKDYNRYLNNILQDTDPLIFSKTKNYSRKCQVSDLRQPVVITKEQKKKIDEMGYSDGYDNYLEYGSSENKQNVYICPKIYCPGSQIPLSYEKYKELGEKCPNPEEEPILLYESQLWNNDPTLKHYIGFLKERGYNNLKLPCCFKKEQKIKDSVTVKKQDVEEDTYIIDKIKINEVGRYGTIPSELHNFLYKGVPYSLCKNTVKAKECLLRIGIGLTKDSLMESIAYLLSFNSKSDLIEHIYKTLDPFTFMCLENGNILTYFMDENSVIPEDNQNKFKDLKKWLEKHDKYVKLFNLQEIRDSLSKKIENINENIKYKISRQLAIYNSFYNFLRYLKDDINKNPYLLFDLVRNYGALMVVWNRESQDLISLRCPYTVKNKSWFSGQKDIPYILVMQQENSYYEPLVIVEQKRKIIQKIAFTKFEKLESLISKCPDMMKYEDSIIHNIYTLSKWVVFILGSNKYKLDRLVLDENHNGIGIFLENNIYITFPKLSQFSLINLIDICNIKRITFLEDIQSKVYNIIIDDINIYKLFQKKIKLISFGIDIGVIIEQSNDILNSIYTVPKVKYSVPPKIPVMIKDNFIKQSNSLKNKDKEWYNTKKTILGRLVNEYNKLVSSKKNKETNINELYDEFEYLNQSNKVITLLQELPLNRKEKLEQIYKQHLLEKPYYQKDNKIYEGYRNKEWIFTQKVILEPAFNKVKYSKNIKLPIKEPDVSQEIINSVYISDEKDIPDMLNINKLKNQILPSNKFKNKFWKSFTIGYYNKYTRDSLINVIIWIAKSKGILFSKEDLTYYLRKYVYDILESKENIEYLFNDPSMVYEWKKNIDRKFRNINELVRYVKEQNKKELLEIWKNIVNSNELWIQNIDLSNISKLLDISFLVFQKSGSSIIDSTNFISNMKKNNRWLYNPILLLYREVSDDDNTHSIYNIICNIDKNICYYSQGQLIPNEIKKLITTL